MKAYDFTPLKTNDVEYQNLVASVTEHYIGDWDDRIHESYMKYLKQVAEHSSKVNDIKCKIEAMEKEVCGFKTEELQIRAESLCREADAI